MDIQPTSNWWQKIRKFYTDNFPTDKESCAVLLTLISTTLSSLNFLILTYNIRYTYFFEGFCFVLTFLLITASANYFLYRGLLSDEWKKISLLILLKSVEIIWCSGVLISIYCTMNWWYIKHRFDFLVSYPLLIGLNALYTCCILRKVKEMKRRAHGNIYAMNDFIEPLTSKVENGSP